jgi:hypothetical protein
MPTWIWNKILRQWWNSSTNGEIDNVYRWIEHKHHSKWQDIWIGIGKVSKLSFVENSRHVQTTKICFLLREIWLNEKVMKIPRLSLLAAAKSYDTCLFSSQNAPPQCAEMLLREPDLFLQRKPSFSPEDGISLRMIVNFQWPNRLATISFKCCTQNSLGFPERRLNQGTVTGQEVTWISLVWTLVCFRV